MKWPQHGCQQKLVTILIMILLCLQQFLFYSKCRLIKPPVLHMPNTTGRFHLYSNMSKFATGSVMYQIQNGKPKLIAYASKRLAEAAKNIL